MGRMRAGSLLFMAALLLPGCGPLTHPSTPASSGSDAARPSAKAVPTPGGPVVDPAGLRCLTELRRMGVRTDTVSYTNYATPADWQRITLASNLTAGPFSASIHDASSIETATWNLLSSSVGLSLTPYLGRSVTVVQLQSYGSTAVGGYTCLVYGSRVVGVFAQTKDYSYQPMFDVSVRGRTVRELTGVDYLQWLESTRAYRPRPTPDTPSLTAAEVLLDWFAVTNAPLSSNERQSLMQGLWPGVIGPDVYLSLVPISITRLTQGPSSTMNPSLEQEFSVAELPDFRKVTPGELAGNAGVQMLYTVQRRGPRAPWHVVGEGTGG